MDLAEAQPGSEDRAHTWTAVHSSALKSGPRHSMAPAAWQAVRRGLPQAHWQRYSTVSCLPPPYMRGPAGHTQICHAHLFSLPGSLAVVCQHQDSHQPAAAPTTPCRPPPRRRQAGSVAAISRVGQPMAAPQTADYDTALGSILHSSVAARPSDDHGAHRSEGLSSSQRPGAPRLDPAGSDIRLRAGVLSHWLRGRQPSMTQEQFQQCWCHGNVLCSQPEDMEEPPHIHWTAAAGFTPQPQPARAQDQQPAKQGLQI